MGTKHCVIAPRDQDENGKKKNNNNDDDSSDSESEDEENGKGIYKIINRVHMESKLNSEDFKSDPRKYFRTNIKNICKRKRLPFLNEIHKYNFYIWSSNKCGFGHDSVVIGSAYNNQNDHSSFNDNNYGYITAELCIDMDDGTIFPNSRYLNKYEAQEYLDNDKWRWQYSYTTTLNNIIDFILALIANHGKYSSIHNGCQHFVQAFLTKICESEKEFRIYKKLKDNKIYQNTKSEYIRGVQRYRALNKVEKELKKEGLCPKYDTFESTLQTVGTMMVLPVVAMAISKETVKHNRDKVQFQCIDIDKYDQK